jgi:hypothetical protein
MTLRIAIYAPLTLIARVESYPNALHTAPRRRGRRSSNNANARTTLFSTMARACAATGMCAGALVCRMNVPYARPDSGALSRTLSGCARTMPFRWRDPSSPLTAHCAVTAGSRIVLSHAASAGRATPAPQSLQRLYVSLVPTLPHSLLPARFALPTLIQGVTPLPSAPIVWIMRHRLPALRLRHSVCVGMGSTRAD